MSDDAHPLRAYRKRKGLSLRGLADKLDWSIRKVSMIENWLQDVPEDELQLVKRVTGIPISELRPQLAKAILSEAECR
jgi:transcriptional regulator with XRE-family HTH domain